jgi:hypothetical protein
MAMGSSASGRPSVGRASVAGLVVGAAMLSSLSLFPRVGAAHGDAVAPVVHGADSTFVGHGVAIVWAVLRGGDEASTLVVVDVAPLDPTIRALAVDAVNPSTRSRLPIVPPSELTGGASLRIPRGRFMVLPRTEFRFASAPAALAPGLSALTVYFTGVPEATPEFTDEAALSVYLAGAVTRARGR